MLILVRCYLNFAIYYTIIFVHVLFMLFNLETLAELVTILKVEMIEEHVKNSGMKMNFNFSFFFCFLLIIYLLCIARELSTF